jgi:membrane protease YdiL (CAAX protease family)
MTRTPPQLRIALLLGAGAALATACVFPYLLALQPGAFSFALLSPTLLVVAQSIQTALFCLLLGWAGLKIGAPLGLGAPWLATLLYQRPRPLRTNWLLAGVAGVVAGAAILAAVALFGSPLGDSSIAQQPAVWKGLLAAPYGAIVEETLCRAFLLGVIAWLLARTSAGVPHAWQIITAIILAAALFGAGHLPLAGQLGPLDAGVVARIIGYNAVAGVVFGWLYWKRGLEHAMLAHFCADLVLHGIAPALTT